MTLDCAELLGFLILGGLILLAWIVTSEDRRRRKEKDRRLEIKRRLKP